MRSRSDLWDRLTRRGYFALETKAIVGGKEYAAISAPVIDRTLMSSPLSVGNCSAATLSLSILTDDQIPPSASVTIVGRVTGGDGETSEWMRFGTYYIDQRDASYEGLVTVSCYDAMLKANQSYLTDDDTSTGWPKSMLSVVEEIAYRIGVGVDLRTRINTGDDYVVPYPEGKTMLQVLGCIGACHGGNWVITEDNLLRLVPLTTAPDETYHIIDEDYDTISLVDPSESGVVRLAYKDQTVFNAVLPLPSGDLPDSKIPRTYFITDTAGNKVVTSDRYYLIWDTDANVAKRVSLRPDAVNVPIVCGKITTGTQITVTGVSMTGENSESYTAGDDSGAVIKIESNPYASQNICDDLYAAYAGMAYQPFTATKATYDPAAELGDQVVIGDMVCSALYGLKLRLDCNFSADINAPNSEELNKEYPYLSEVEHLRQTTEELNGAIQKTANELVGKVDDAALAAEIKRAEGVETELNTRIENEKTRAEDAEATLRAGVSQNETSVENIRTALAAINSALEAVYNRLDALENPKTTE